MIETKNSRDADRQKKKTLTTEVSFPLFSFKKEKKKLQ